MIPTDQTDDRQAENPYRAPKGEEGIPRPTWREAAARFKSREGISLALYLVLLSPVMPALVAALVVTYMSIQVAIECYQLGFPLTLLEIGELFLIPTSAAAAMIWVARRELVRVLSR
ncbi:MAG: hypothetical protein WD847_13680 [Pirellulales bacterium]